MDEDDARKAGQQWGIGCLLIPVALIGGCWATSAIDGGGDDPAETAADFTWSAESVCRDAVTQQLKDPDSAKFSDIEVRVTDTSAPEFGYTVTGTVRAANSFGGVAVHDFSCDATHDPSDGMARGRARVS